MYERDMVDLTEAEHKVAREWNDVIVAVVDNDGNRITEAIEAVTATIQNLGATKEERLTLLLKAGLANLSNEMQQRLLAEPNLEIP